MVVAAQRRNDPGGERALARLCEAYWYPLYAFVRRQGRDPDEARDLTQGYFLKLLEKDFLDDVDQSSGRFRSFLLKSLQHFIINEWKAARAIKRGGGKPLLSLDLDGAERQFRAEHSDSETPEIAFERRWARLILDRTMSQLRDDFSRSGKLDYFQRIAPFLTGATQGQPYAEIAREFELSESGVKMSVQRARRRYGELLRKEVSRTLADDDDVDAELRYLFEALES